MLYLGDFVKGETVRFAFNTAGADGASITRSGDGTIHVYKDLSTTTEVTTGITNVEDADAVTGVHFCEIATTGAFYDSGSEFVVVLKAATIDTKTVNAALAHFSIGRKTTGVAHQGLAQAGAAGTVTLASTAVATDDYYNGAVAFIASGTGVGQTRYISDYVGATKVATVTPNWTTTPSTDSFIVTLAGIVGSSASDIAAACTADSLRALQTYSRTTNTAATLDGETLVIVTDAAYLPIKSIA